MTGYIWEVAEWQKFPKVREQVNAIIDRQIAAISGIPEFTYKKFKWGGVEKLTNNEPEAQADLAAVWLEEYDRG